MNIGFENCALYERKSIESVGIVNWWMASNTTLITLNVRINENVIYK